MESCRGALAGSWGVLGELWEGLGELWESFGRVSVSCGTSLRVKIYQKTADQLPQGQPQSMNTEQDGLNNVMND